MYVSATVVWMSLQWQLWSPALSCSAGLAGFCPLHPMTITEAERRRAQAEQTEKTTVTEDSVDEGQRLNTEVWELKPGTFICEESWLVFSLVGKRQLLEFAVLCDLNKFFAYLIWKFYYLVVKLHMFWSVFARYLQAIHTTTEKKLSNFFLWITLSSPSFLSCFFFFCLAWRICMFCVHLQT